MSLKTNGKIDSLQALRTIAFLGVFFVHADFCVEWGVLGVTVFFVMSGFLLMVRNDGKDLGISLKKNFLFSINKIKRLYPLHIIMMVCMIALTRESYRELEKAQLISQIKVIAAHIFLVQTWKPAPEMNTSINGVAWYLSVALFLYFVFPIWHKLVKNLKTWIMFVISLVIIAIEIIVCIYMIGRYGNGDYTYLWFVYCFPVFRLGDFLIGTFFGRLYLDINELGSAKATIIEIMACALAVFVCWWNPQSHTNIVSIALNNWTTVYIPVAGVWIYLFAVNQGYITKVLSNKLLIFVGNISGYLFLIHYAVIYGLKQFLDIRGINRDGYRHYLVILAELVISIILSLIYKAVSDSIGKGRKAKQ